MKMSRSIKDYKDAMDSIKISDSFYKRTENLLNDLSEDEIEKKPFRISNKVTAGIMAAAACIVCVIGIRVVLDVREDNIESSAETSLTRITTEITTDVASVPELIDIPEGFSEDEELEAAVGDAADNPVDPTAPAAEAAPEDKSADDPVQEDTGIAYISGQGPYLTIPAEDEEDRQEAENIGYPDISVEGIKDIPDIKDIDPESVDIEITPYFDMDNVVSGEGAIKKSGTDSADVLELIKEAAENSPTEENSGFSSVFMVEIIGKDSGKVFYSIYITDSGDMVTTKHSSPQERITYRLTAESYDSICRTLFLMFGEEEDYDLFISMTAGK